MNRKLWMIVVALALASVLALNGCNAAPAGGTPAATAKAATDAPKNESTDTPSTTTLEETTALPTEGAQPAPDAFRYYSKVKLGMSKAESDAAIGLEANEAKGQYEPENAFNYFDDDGYGVYVLYNKDLKAYSKTVIYPHAGEALAPLTKKPVTEEQADGIEKGTTHSAVIDLLGRDGVECSVTADENDVTKIQGRILRWGNADDSGIQIVFVADDTAQNILFFD